MSPRHLCPCPTCNRHVMTDAGVCPFCQADLPASFCETPVPPVASGRMSRAARLLAGATLVGASACSSVAPPPTTIAHYGGPMLLDAGADSGTGGTTGNDADDDRSAVPLYGAAPVDSGQK